MKNPPSSPLSTTRSTPDPWSDLRQLTQARIALGSIGASLPTAEVLSFSLDHARARDAVHLPFDTEALASQLQAAGFQTLNARSQAATRQQYLARPDLGRRLHTDSVLSLATEAVPNRLTVILADGLSALAPDRHALPLLLELQPHLSAWTVDTIILATQARVALADEIGQLRHAEATLILLGERPGLSSPDSLGAYLTYAPRPGRADSERNCVSNIRPGGLSYAEAAHKILGLLAQARAAQASGIAIKDLTDGQAPPKSLP